MILHNFTLLQAFTVYMENSLRFEISLQLIWPSEIHVNSDKEVTSHRSEILAQSEITNRFEFTSGLI